MSHPLNTLFCPRSVAIIGAGEKQGSLGRTLVANMQTAGFQGKIYPVNPRYSSVLGLPCYSTVAEVPEIVDLAVIVTNAQVVKEVIQDCISAKVATAIVISSGFKEIGEEGKKREEEILALASQAGLRILGPNCLGCINPHIGLNATFAAGMASKGRVAFISQSGALCTAVLDWSLQNGLGFSAFVSLGSMSDIGWGDLIEYLGEDPHTQAILMYMETIGDSEKFLRAVRKVAIEKPLIVIKAGRTQAAVQAAVSHTGSLAGSDDVFSAAMAQMGILRVHTIKQLFDLAMCLGHQPLPQGPHLSIVTNAGGPAVLSTDAAVLHGALLTELQPHIRDSLNEFLPSAWSHGNPIDLLGDADAMRYDKAIKVAIEDPQADGLLVILTPQDMTEAKATAEALIKYSQNSEKPILASWMGGASVEDGRRLLREAGIPCFAYPDAAASTFAALWKHNHRLHLLEEEYHKAKFALPSAVKEMIGDRLAEFKRHGHTLLSEAESKKVLMAYGIPAAVNILAETEEEAEAAAREIGYPVVMKVHSVVIVHKSDIGGVKLNLQDAAAVKKAFREIKETVIAKLGEEDFEGVGLQPMIQWRGIEVIFGAHVDPQWGPVILFGTGGEYVEVLRDRVLGLPPLTTSFARQMIEQTKIYPILAGARGRAPINMEMLIKMLVRFAQMVVEQPLIQECDINPLMIAREGMIALDARFIL
jgi:acetyltransferase